MRPDPVDAGEQLHAVGRLETVGKPEHTLDTSHGLRRSDQRLLRLTLGARQHPDRLRLARRGTTIPEPDETAPFDNG
ncbi:MAG: hypothetical protein ACRDYX_11485 [Egibacteraceae bacterium]